MAAIGLTVDDEAAVEVRAASELGNRQMAALFPTLLSAFRSGVDEVALPLMPFMHAYAARLKVQHKRSVGLLGWQPVRRGLISWDPALNSSPPK
jgi:hypothetical protein